VRQGVLAATFSTVARRNPGMSLIVERNA